MKVLSKYFKVALCFMAFALCSFMFAFTPTYTAVQAAEMALESYNVAINALKMPTEEVNYENGDVFEVPLLASSMGTTTPEKYTIKVVDPAGYVHKCDIVYDDETDPSNPKYVVETKETAFFGNINENKLTINAKNDGDYKILYVTTIENKTYYSNTYTVSVTNVSHELDFTTPVVNADKEIVGYSKNILPSKLAESTEKYYLPVAYAKIKGNDLTIDQTDGKVTNFSTLTTDDKVSIKVTLDGDPQGLEEEGTIFGKDADGYYITPSKEGVYTVEYSYENSANRPTKTFTINVEKNYERSNLKLASTPTMPNVELGKTIKLPNITVNAGDEKNVEVNIESIVIEKENSNGAIKCVLENNTFEFVMSPESFTGVEKYEDMTGNYRITYTVKDAYGKTLTETFKISDVTVSEKPSIKLSYNYDATQANYGESVVLGAETELKAEYAADNEFVLPAVYVEDAVTTNFEDFIIVRAIRKGSTYYYVDNYKYDEDSETGISAVTDKYKNASGDANIGDPTKAVKFRFDEEATNLEGTYYLEYRVISKQVKQRENYLYVDGTSTKYSFKIVNETSSLTEYVNPTIEITNLKDSSVKNNEQITVKVSPVDEFDTRLKNAVFTYTGTTANTETGLTTFADYLAFVSDNLDKTIGTNKSTHLFNDSRLIDGWIANEGTAEEVEYNGLSHYFTNIKNIAENETKNNFDLDLSSYSSGSVTVVAATINDGGKIATTTKTLNIKNTNDSVAPSITVYSAGKWAVEGSSTKLDDATFVVGQGETVELPSVYVLDADKTLSLNVMYYIDTPENAYGAIKYLSPSNKSFYYDNEIVSGEEVQVINGGKIVTSETGVYYVAYTATDVAGNTSVMYFTFEVVDTSKPILTVEPVANDVTISGNVITGGKGTVIDFETTLKSADGKNDYTTVGDMTITIEDDGKGLDYQPSGNSRTSYVFNSYGTYIVTVGGEHTINLNGSDKTLTADSKTFKVVIEKQNIEWLGEFDVPAYATQGEDLYLPDVAASSGAVVKVTYVTPGNSSSDAIDATKVVHNGFTYWTFKTSETTKGTYTVTYTATNDEDVLVKTISIKVGDNVAPTLSFNKGELVQDYVYNNSDIEYVLEVNKSKKTFVVKVINGGEEVISHDLGLVISDRDDTGILNNNMSWTNLKYELTGDNVTKGESSTKDGTTKTQYLIKGTGKYALTLTMKDSYDNERVSKIEFNVVSESSVSEKDDSVIGAVLIVISLILLAGVILFFMFTGKGSTTKTTKTKKVAKAKSVKKVEDKKAEDKKVEENEVNEVVAEEVVAEEKSEEVVSEEEVQNVETENVETSDNDEAKTGDVE